MGFEIHLKDGDFYYLNDDGEYVKIGSGIVDADADWVTVSEAEHEVVEEDSLRLLHMPAEELEFECTICSEPQPVADVDAVVVEEEELA